MHAEAEELIRLKNRIRRLSGMALKPSPIPGLSPGGSSSKKASPAAQKLPSLINEPAEKLLDQMTCEQIEASKNRVDAMVQVANARIAIACYSAPTDNKKNPVKS